MSFCTVINCIDKRVEIHVIRYLQKRFDVKYVNSITEPEPNIILAERKDTILIQSILEKLKISIENHYSVRLAIVGHHNYAGNPRLNKDQIIYTQKSNAVSLPAT